MRKPGAASDSLAPFPSSWKALLLSSFRVGETCLRRKKLRKRVLRAVQAACEAAGVAAPGRAELKAKFAAKLAACGKLAVEGNQVLLRAAQKEAEQPPLPAPAEPEEEEEEEEEGDEEETPDARRRSQPSYQAWHTAPLAQRSGPWSLEERSALDESIRSYARLQGLDEENTQWLFNTRAKKTELHKVWLEISRAVPHRSPRQVWNHATRRLHTDFSKGAWSEQEKRELLLQVERHGHNWVDIGQELGRPRAECRERWRNLKGGYKKGAWTEQEVEQLKSLVAEFKHRPLPLSRSVAFVRRDNIDWEAMSLRMGTRRAQQLCDKWYNSVAPSMKETGEWGTGDDDALLASLQAGGATEEVEADWQGAVVGRAASACLRRWRVMLKHVAQPAEQGFQGCVEQLLDIRAKQLAKKAAAAEEG